MTLNRWHNEEQDRVQDGGNDHAERGKEAQPLAVRGSVGTGETIRQRSEDQRAKDGDQRCYHGDDLRFFVVQPGEGHVLRQIGVKTS